MEKEGCNNTDNYEKIPNPNITPNESSSYQTGQSTSQNVTILSQYNVVDNHFYSEPNEIKSNIQMIEGEVIKDSVVASFKAFNQSSIGVLGLSNFRLIFNFDVPTEINLFHIKPDFFDISLFQIEKASKSQEKDKDSAGSYPIDIILKDTRVIRLFTYDKDYKIVDAINKACNPKNIQSFYSYSIAYLTHISNQGNYCNGWILYDPIKEFERQGVSRDNKLNLRYCDANKDFKLCQTYPELLIVHAGMNDDNLKEASKHRTKNRLPVLTYYYGKGGKNAQTGYPSIWRSSQTKSGITGTNKRDMDILLLETITGLSNKLYIFDARPFINALANRVNGGGYENVNHYTNVEIIFCDIDNIHAVRNSANKVYQLCKSAKIMDNQKFWSALEATNWYFFVHLLLKYSTEITLKLLDNCSVLNHCSDGWDRTAQLVSLSQLLIDPYYRTIFGFGVLFEKDWLSFGHQFGLRNGIYTKEPKEDQCSPIFLQFLDCVHQLLVQFPNAFEFNDSFLVFIANSITSNQYGTFMYNSDYERLQMKAKEKTVSIWSDIIKDISKYFNPHYQSYPIINDVLKPNFAPCCLSLWSEYFMQHNINLEYTPIMSTIVDKDNKRSDEIITQKCNTSNEFYMYHSRQKDIQAKKNYASLEEQYNKLKQFVSTVYNKTLNDDKLKDLNEKAQSILMPNKANTTTTTLTVSNNTQNPEPKDK